MSDPDDDEEDDDDCDGGPFVDMEKANAETKSVCKKGASAKNANTKVHRQADQKPAGRTRIRSRNVD